MAWTDQAACRGAGVKVFFAHSEGDQKDYAQAKSKVDVIKRDYCLICPVKQECLEFAIANGERFGIWGGMDEQERNTYKRKMKTL